MTLAESIALEIKETEAAISDKQSYLGKLRKMLARAKAEAPARPRKQYAKGLTARGKVRKRRPKGYLAKRVAEVLKRGPMPMKEIKASLKKQGEVFAGTAVENAVIASKLFKRHGVGVYGLVNGKA